MSLEIAPRPRNSPVLWCKLSVRPATLRDESPSGGRPILKGGGSVICGAATFVVSVQRGRTVDTIGTRPFFLPAHAGKLRYGF